MPIVDKNGNWVEKPEQAQRASRDESRKRTVYITDSGSNCGAGFKMNEEFLIFSAGYDSFQTTNQCDGSGHISRKQDDIKIIETLTDHITSQ